MKNVKRKFISSSSYYIYQLFHAIAVDVCKRNYYYKWLLGLVEATAKYCIMNKKKKIIFLLLKMIQTKNACKNVLLHMCTGEI